MPPHKLAGQPAPSDLLISIPEVITRYYEIQPDPENSAHDVNFGTSGHRGSSLKSSFNEAHILAIAQAVAEYRDDQDITGPLFLGMDSHALSECAWATAVQVLVANGVEVYAQPGSFTATPLVSHAILEWNCDDNDTVADGIVITPSHNPPQDGGFKYNPPNGGPADTDVTAEIQERANELLGDLSQIKRISLEEALDEIIAFDFVEPYVQQLADVIDMEAIAKAGIHIGVDPLGGAALPVWEAIAEQYDLKLEIVNPSIDPRFAFMPVDHDGKIRMDCSSHYAMAGLLDMKNDFDLSIGNDPDADRHGIVTSNGLMQPNHYLAVMIHYLIQNRPEWSDQLKIGKTLVSSALIDRVVASLNRQLVEMPVGFKYFVDGLLDGSLAFGGEESAGASFLRLDGTAWCTDKDGMIAGLLAAEIMSKTGKKPCEYYQELCQQFGETAYGRLDAPATTKQKKALKQLSPDQVKTKTLAGDPITECQSHAAGNGEAIGGLKVSTEHAWFAARPSGTEAIYKIYGESFRGEEHLQQVFAEAKALVDEVL